MNLDLTNPLIVFAIIVALGTMVAALIKAMAPFKANANQHNVITLLEAQKGRNRVKIEQLKGTDSAFKMEARIQNANNFQIDVFSDSGTVFDTSDKKLQRMVAVRPQVFEVSPASSEGFTIDALCMDAFKAPPPSTGEGAYKVQGVTGDKKIMSLIQALRNIEEDISEKIVSFEVGKGFTVKPMDADIEELLRNCELFPNKDGTYTAKIGDIIIQCALWQITDTIPFSVLAKLTDMESEESRGDLRRFVRLAKIILGNAGVKPSISLI